MKRSGERITVVGSYNVALFFQGEVLPTAGQTMLGDVFRESYGGKGSDQAAAAAILGGDVHFIATLGDDKYGRDALAMYKEKGVSSDGIKIDPTIHSGMSVIILDAEGRNLISVVPGANLRLNKDDIDRQAENIAASRIVGFQLESDPETVAYGIAKAHGLGVETLLDPAPVCPLPDEIFPNLTYIKPNEHEASLLTGIQVTDRLTASKAAKWLLGKGVKHVLITLGEAGCLISDSDGERFIDGIRVDPKDTTGAGDCFSGSFMFGLARGLPIDAAASFANCAASISVTRPSIVESYPTLGEVTARMKELGLASGGVLAKLEGGAK